MILGADQFASSAADLIARAKGWGESPGTIIQQTYRAASERITGKEHSGLEYTLDSMYFSAEVIAACVTSTISIKAVVTAVKGTKTVNAGQQLVSANGMLKWEVYYEAGITWTKAAGTVASESISVTVSGLSFIPAQPEGPLPPDE
jgi:hypothetical protein